MATSSPHDHTYHIFLSFRGSDTRKTFTDHLYTALTNSGFHTFRDNDAIHKGKSIQPELETAIKQSKIAVIVFSKHYASSKWCLNELVSIMARKTCDASYCVFPVFYDVDPTEVGNQKGRFKDAFDEFERKGEFSEERIGEWRNALKVVSKLTGKVMQDEANGHEAVFIQSIVEEVGIILKRTVLALPLYTVGVESRVKDIDLWLKDPTAVRIGVISGMRGIGKTTIAKVAYNLNYADFEASSFLANIREASEQQNGLVRLQNQLLSDIFKGRRHKIYNSAEGMVKIQEAICQKRLLIILDDVDQMDQIETLIGTRDSFHKGSKIIITTYRERLLYHQKHKTFSIKQLDNDESLQLFCWHAFSEDRPMEGYLEHSERVVRHCEGLPLALQVMGSSLFGRNSDFWKCFLEKLQINPDERIRKKLEVSYKSLHDHNDQRLFLTIASSLVGVDIDHAVKMLEKSDFYSEIGMQNLMDISLISVDKDNRLIMHHMVQEMAKAIIRLETIDGSEKYKLYHLTVEETDTVTTKASLLSKNKKCGKRKYSEYEGESMAPNEEREGSFKRLCLHFFSLFGPATHLMKLLTGQER